MTTDLIRIYPGDGPFKGVEGFVEDLKACMLKAIENSAGEIVQIQVPPLMIEVRRAACAKAAAE